jgi:hypothetical protein
MGDGKGVIGEETYEGGSLDEEKVSCVDNSAVLLRDYSLRRVVFFQVGESDF